MNYFSRLADRSGLSASPRGAVTPMPGAAAAAISPGDRPPPGDLPPPPETPASDAPATMAQTVSGPPTAIGPAAAPTLSEPMGTMPAAASEGRPRTAARIVEPSAPAHPIERETTPTAPLEWVASVPATRPEGSLHDQASIAPLHPREIERETPPAAAGQIVTDVSRPRIDAESASSRPAPSPQVAAGEPAIGAAEYDIEVPPPTQAAPSRAGAGGERAASQMSSRLRPAQPVPETDEDIAVPALRVAPAAGPGREDRDTMARRHDRTATTAPRPHTGKGTRGASVEVRIGVVTLQVHAPQPPAPLPAPARDGVAPHRHYLRTW